jgi:phosphoglycolate phosphatase
MATLLFDMDGTLLDSRAAVTDAVARGLARAYADLDLPPAPADMRLIESCMGLPTHAYFEAAYDHATVPPDRRAAFAAAYRDHTTAEEQAAIARGETALYDGVETALVELRRRGHTLLLFSNAGTVYFRAVVAGHGLERFFARTLCIEEAHDGGLARDKAGMVAALVGDPTRAVVVGDRVHDVDAGRAAGARTVGCLYGFGSPEELGAADWIVDGPLQWLDLPLDRL